MGISKIRWQQVAGFVVPRTTACFIIYIYYEIVLRVQTNNQLVKIKKNTHKLDCRNWGCYIRAAPHQLATHPLYLHRRSVPSPSQWNAQIAITGRFEHGVKSVYQFQRTHEFALPKVLNLIQPYRSSAFMHFGTQNFAQMLSTPGSVYPENLTGGYSRKFL